jgi:hypothetical protein
VSGYENALRASGPYVQLEAAQWLPETADHDTPEFLLDAIRDARAKRARDEVHAHLALIPEREALALMLSEGLFGHSARVQREVASYLGAGSQQAVQYTIRRAKVRVKYLLTRPAVDAKRLAAVLSEKQLGVVLAVFETASFTEVARRRWTCPAEGLTSKQRHSWIRTRSRRVKREFFFALAKVKRAGLPEQVDALRHLVAHLGVLSYHNGKGRRA